MTDPNRDGDGFLLKALDLMTGAWVKRYSLVAVPPLRLADPSRVDIQQRNRDIFVSVMFAASIAVVAFFQATPPGPRWLLHAVAGLGLYRAIDVFITIIRTGIFFSFRGDVDIKEEPLWRVRRVLVGVFLNYIELVMWYAVVYLDLGRSGPSQFSERITAAHQALNLSFTTMTTIGYGRYGPDRMLSTVLTFFESLTGIVLLTMVIGVLVSMLAGNEERPKSPRKVAVERPTWIRPLFAFLVGYALCLTLLGMGEEPPAPPETPPVKAANGGAGEGRGWNGTRPAGFGVEAFEGSGVIAES